MGATYRRVGAGATGRHHETVAARAVRASTVAIVVTLLTIAGPLPASSAMASTVPHSTGSGTLKATAIVSPLSYWFALNDSNQVAGQVVVEPTSYAARWSDGVTTKFASGGPDGGGGAFSIDDAGALFGAVVNAAHDGYPAVWSPTGTLTKFTAQAGYEDSFNVRVYAASNNGNLVGVSNESHTSTTIHWFYALAPGYAVVPVDTSTGAGFPSSMAINNSGTIAVGNATTPYLLVNGVRRSLKVSITTNFDLNNNGDVAGRVVPAPTSGNSQAAIELANGTVQVLPPLHADDEVTVNALNDNDEAVGSDVNSSTGASTAVAWIDGKVSPVTSLIAGSFSTPLSQAVDVNNNGSILAASVAGSTQNYYLLEASGISGTVFGEECSATGCPSTGLPGLPGQTILVQGKANDGSEVKTSAVTNENGQWSVSVPAGRYLVGPTFDGETIDGEGFTPEPQTVDLGVKSVPNVNFSTCAGPATAGAAPASSDGQEAALVREAMLSGGLPACDAEYTFQVSASVHEATFVDPSLRAPFAPAADGGGYRANNQESGPWRGKVPECPEFSSLASGPPALKWSSYYQGATSLGSAGITLVYNAHTDSVSELQESASEEGSPTLHFGRITRVFHYEQDGTEHTCSATRPVSMLVTTSFGSILLGKPQVGNEPVHGFQIVVSWALPFSPEGYVTGADDIPKLPGVATGLHKLVHAAADAVPGFEKLPAPVQGAIVTVVAHLVEEEGLGKNPPFGTIKNLVLAEVEFEKIWNLPVAGLYDFVASQTSSAEGYHPMIMVIRGEMIEQPCPANYYPGHNPTKYRACRDTSLAFDVSTPDFPDFHVDLYRNSGGSKQLVPTAGRHESPPESVVVDAGPSAAKLPNVETSTIAEQKGGAPYVNDLAHAMAEVRPVTAFFSGTTTFVGTPPKTPSCAQYADHSLGFTAPGTPYSRCYVWLDTKP